MPTVLKYPTVATYEQLETDQFGTHSETPWLNLNNIKLADDNDANSDLIASHSGTVSKAGRVKVTGFGFNFKDNTRINSILVSWEEYVRNPSGGVTGVPTIPSKSAYLLYANGGSNSVKKTDPSTVPTNRTTRSLSYAASEMPSVKPAYLESANFGVYFDPARNTSSNTGRLFLDYINALVDFTDPTYMIGATLSAGKIVGDLVTYTLTLTNTNKCHNGIAIPVTITLPSGLTYNSQSGNGSYNTSTNKWNAVLNSSGVATLTLVLNSTSSGTKSISASVDGFSVSLSKSTIILPPTYTLTSPTNSHSVTETHDLTYTITVTVNSASITSVPVNIPIPTGMTYGSSSGNGSYNSTTHVWTATFVNKTATLTFTLHAITAGQVTQTITADTQTLTKTITIISATVTTPFYTDYQLPAEVLDYIQNGEQYALSCYQLIKDTVASTVYPGDKNFKISIINGPNEYFSDRATALNTLTRISTLFTYDSSQTIKLRVYGQYVEINPANATVSIGGFALYLGSEIDYQIPAVIFEDPENLIDDGNYSAVIIYPNQDGASVLLSNINFAGRDLDKDLIIKGIGISGDLYTGDNVDITVVMHSLYETHSKSIIALMGDIEFSMGGETDKWGFNSLDLDTLCFELQVNNIGVAPIEVGIKDVQVTLYYQYDETGDSKGLTLDGVHSREKNMFLSPGFEKPEGLSTDIVTLKLERTDGEKLTSSTVKSKTFKIIFQIVADDFEDANDKLIEIIKWLTNDRDDYQIPITKAMVFDWDPNRTYNVILDDDVDVKLDVSKYECTANFIVPEGVGWTAEKITGAMGINSGLIPIRPLIQVICDGSSEVVLHESNTGQLLRISNTFAAGTVLLIDCNKRTIMDPTGTNYISSVGLDSYWFKIARDYDFSDSTGCTIQMISYNEAV